MGLMQDLYGRNPHPRGLMAPLEIQKRGTVVPAGVDQYGRPVLAAPQGLLDFLNSARGLIDNPVTLDNITSPQMVGDAANVAGGVTLGAGAMPARNILAGGKPDIGIFGGQGAKTADKFALDAAEQMEKAGAHRGSIFDETGWFRGVDGEWRFEIDDSLMKHKAGAAPKQRGRIDRAMEFFDEGGIPREKFGTPEFKDETNKAFEMADRAMSREGLDAIPLSSAIDHPELLAAYPDLAKIPYAEGADHILKGARGGYIPSADSVVMGTPDITGRGWDSRSTLLHEIQHAIQEREGFAKGSSPDRVKLDADSELASRTREFSTGAAKWDDVREKASPVWKAQYVDRLDKMIERPSLKPSEVFRISDWYSHGRKITDQLGQMPKKPGANRDEWLRGAVRIIKEEYLKELGATDAANLKRLMEKYPTPRERKNAGRRLEREMDKYAADARKMSEIRAARDELQGLSDMDAYRRAAGEVEARNVQARRDFTASERAKSYPWETQDQHDLNQFVFGRRKASGLMKPEQKTGLLYGEN